MKILPNGLQAHLDSGATTLCWCWRVKRRDGTVLGFTDHDRDLTFDATTFEAAAGLEAGEISDSIGLSVNNLEVGGALASERLTDADLADGLYDDAAIEIFRVNWQATEQRVLMQAGSIGEVQRAGTAFTAELRGLAHYLQQPKGRVFQYACDTDLGSAACGIDLTRPVYRADATVAEIRDAHAVRINLSASYEAGWFTRGLATFTNGAAQNFASEVRAHWIASDGNWLSLWQAPVASVAVGDALVVTAGCDKQFETCQARFQNAVNFRGFPHMPGNDFVTGVARQGR